MQQLEFVTKHFAIDPEGDEHELVTSQIEIGRGAATRESRIGLYDRSTVEVRLRDYIRGEFTTLCGPIEFPGNVPVSTFYKDCELAAHRALATVGS